MIWAKNLVDRLRYFGGGTDMASRIVSRGVKDGVRTSQCSCKSLPYRTTSTKRRSLYLLIGFALVVFVLAGCTKLSPPAEEPPPPAEREQVVVEDADVMTFPLSTFDDYKAHYYTYANEGRLIKFFVLKSTDGVVRAAFDACDICYEAKKGYSQDGNAMICNECGRSFPADKINEVSGGCNPVPLRRTVDGDSLVIEASDIVAGWRYF